MIFYQDKTSKYFVFLIILLLFACANSKRAKSFDSIAFEEGDLILRKGTGTKSKAVLHVDSTGIYSHVGIVVKVDSRFKVIHITPGERTKGENVDRIKMESIEDFWREDRAQNGAVYRLKDNRLGKRAAQQALRLLHKGILFDHDYELSDSTKMYCTELVCYAYQKGGEDISFGKRSVLNMPLYSGTYIFPSDIYTHDEFQLIYKF